jgi:uroporphyrinogen-III decarboxylase
MGPRGPEVVEVSQTEEKEENVDVERAVKFFQALTDFSMLNPVPVTELLYDVVNALDDMIIVKDELGKRLGHHVGELMALTRLIWNHHTSEALQQMLAEPEVLSDLMDTIARLAKAYHMIRSNENAPLEDVKNLIDNATSTLYRIADYIISSCDP